MCRASWTELMQMPGTLLPINFFLRLSIMTTCMVKNCAKGNFPTISLHHYPGKLAWQSSLIACWRDYSPSSSSPYPQSSQYRDIHKLLILKSISTLCLWQMNELFMDHRNIELLLGQRFGKSLCFTFHGYWSKAVQDWIKRWWLQG